MDVEQPLRIVVVDPPPGVTFALQRGKSELVPPSRSTPKQLVFDLTVRVRDEEQPNFLGPFAQGPRGARFGYINSGTYAGQTNTPWSRRAKVHLSGITWPLIHRANGKPIEARIAGTAATAAPPAPPSPCSTAAGRSRRMRGASRECSQRTRR
jgi:hypothetical protein